MTMYQIRPLSWESVDAGAEWFCASVAFGSFEVMRETGEDAELFGEYRLTSEFGSENTDRKWFPTLEDAKDAASNEWQRLLSRDLEVAQFPDPVTSPSPERIYLFEQDGETVWCDSPASDIVPDIDRESDESVAYVRVDSLADVVFALQSARDWLAQSGRVAFDEELAQQLESALDHLTSL